MVDGDKRNRRIKVEKLDERVKMKNMFERLEKWIRERRTEVGIEGWWVGRVRECGR